MKRRNIIPTILLGMISSAVAFTACKKDANPEKPAAPVYSWVEEFDTLANAVQRGWSIKNNSRPIGIASWTQASLLQSDPISKTVTGTSPFLAQSATYSGKDYVLAGYTVGDGSSTLSCWLISPETTVKNGDDFYFYTRTASDATSTGAYPDRMQVRMNANNASTEVGSNATTVGDFSKLLLDINPTYELSGSVGAYPTEWTRYKITVNGLPADQTVKTRFAFRYYVEDGGSAGSRSFCVGVDSVAFKSN